MSKHPCTVHPQSLFVGVLLLTLAGCEAGPMMSSTTSARDSTLIVEVYAEGPPVVLVTDADREPTSIEALNSAASQGDVHAHRLLGNAYWIGNNSTLNGSNPFPANRRDAVWYYRKAAEAGDVPSAYYLGHALEFGDGVAKDPEAAFQWYQRAAGKGHVRAHGQVGFFYVTGTGNVEVNLARAVEHIRFAATAGDPPSQFNLGVMYANGDGVEKNLEEAARWYWSAADQGNVGAMVQLAKLLRAGDGVPKDALAARQWLELAAEEGSSEASELLEEDAARIAAAASELQS